MSKSSLFVLSLLLTAAVVAPVHADEAAVRKTIDAYVEAFNDKDLDTVASLWAEQGTHIDRETGERTEGRDAIQADLAAVFKERPNTRLAGRVDRVRFIKPDVASVEGQTSVGSPGEEPSLSTFSGIVVNQDGNWVIDSVEEMPLPRPAASGTYVLNRIDNDTLTLELIGHEVEGEPQPTSQAVRVVRVAEEMQPASPQAKQP
jgi:uncharacterized protein (TIGR02246 family)